jgi:hypothetical protein
MRGRERCQSRDLSCGESTSSRQRTRSPCQPGVSRHRMWCGESPSKSCECWSSIHDRAALARNVVNIERPHADGPYFWQRAVQQWHKPHYNSTIASGCSILAIWLKFLCHCLLLHGPSSSLAYIKTITTQIRMGNAQRCKEISPVYPSQRENLVPGLPLPASRCRRDISGRASWCLCEQKTCYVDTF